MEKILSARAPIPFLPPASSSSSSSSYPINKRPGQLGFWIDRRPSRLFKPIRVSLSSSEGVATTKEMEHRHVEEHVDPMLSSIMALSPLDGRYLQKVKDLLPFFSEYGLIHYHVIVEVKWLLKLSQIREIKEIPSFSKSAQSYLECITSNFNKDDALEVKKIEKVTNHDVKAVEYFLKEKCKSNPEIAEGSFFDIFSLRNNCVSSLNKYWKFSILHVHQKI